MVSPEGAQQEERRQALAVVSTASLADVWPLTIQSEELPTLSALSLPSVSCPRVEVPVAALAIW